MVSSSEKDRIKKVLPFFKKNYDYEHGQADFIFYRFINA